LAAIAHADESMVKASSGRHGARAQRRASGSGLIRVIAAFKLVKALLLVGVGLGSLKLLNPTAAETADRWVSALAWRLGPRAASTVRDGLSHVSDSRLKLIGIAAFLYAALFGVEGVGLWMSKRWAEYLTIIATSSFVPFEVYELIRHASWQRGATLGINLLVVGYLVWKVKRAA
jgi:uncharacterized membrane protein (DUF2068 family)